MHGFRGGHRHEDLVTRSQLEHAPLVDGMERVLTIGGPALGADTFEQLDGLWVCRLPVHTLHHRSGLLIAISQGEGAEVDLSIQVIATGLGDPELPVGHGHVVQV